MDTLGLAKESGGLVLNEGEVGVRLVLEDVLHYLDEVYPIELTKTNKVSSYVNKKNRKLSECLWDSHKGLRCPTWIEHHLRYVFMSALTQHSNHCVA